jgi:transcriptional regulator with XRE-family HTH domain
VPSRANAADEAWERYARELGQNIQRERARVGYSQDRVAYESNLSRYTYQKLEKGESRPGSPANPTVKTLLAVAQVLDVQITDLLPPSTPDLTIR